MERTASAERMSTKAKTSSPCRGTWYNWDDSSNQFGEVEAWGAGHVVHRFKNFFFAVNKGGFKRQTSTHVVILQRIWWKPQLDLSVGNGTGRCSFFTGRKLFLVDWTLKLKYSVGLGQMWANYGPRGHFVRPAG